MKSHILRFGKSKMYARRPYHYLVEIEKLFSKTLTLSISNPDKRRRK